MKKSKFLYLTIICKLLFSSYVLAQSLTVANSLSQQSEFPKLTGPYLGQKPPGIIPEIFAENITSAEYDNGGFAFSPNGDEVIFFSIDKKGKYLLHYSKLSNGCWIKPEKIFLSNSGNYIHPFFSTDGKKIFFGSDKRIKPDEKVPYYNIWVSEKLNDKWDEPTPLATTINTGYENCGSFSHDNKLFFRRVSPNTRGDIFLSDYMDGEFTNPVKLSGEINTVYDESHPAVSSDGSYIIFSSKRPGGFNRGKDELWISFKKENREWSEAVNMGKEINNGSNSSCATISPDGKYIFFIRIENGVGVSYWVSTKIIEELRPKKQ